uniref:Uncharacterized protein n=1 Tax=Tanacetum cinerariifolium TaxID=118510 RepID=A0A699H4B6_TANCI|nr:hypothetical protein [Tanacetum cinerariifolium]
MRGGASSSHGKRKTHSEVDSRGFQMESPFALHNLHNQRPPQAVCRQSGHSILVDPEGFPEFHVSSSTCLSVSTQYKRQRLLGLRRRQAHYWLTIGYLFDSKEKHIMQMRP